MPSLTALARSSHARGSIIALALAAAARCVAAEHPPLPPEVIELEAVTVEGERIREEKVKEIEAGSQKFQEELERRGRPERTEISETRDNYGNRKVKVRTRFLTYCFEAPDAATRRNELGENFTLPTNCDDDN